MTMATMTDEEYMAWIGRALADADVEADEDEEHSVTVEPVAELTLEQARALDRLRHAMMIWGSLQGTDLARTVDEVMEAFGLPAVLHREARDAYANTTHEYQLCNVKRTGCGGFVFTTGGIADTGKIATGGIIT